MQREHIIRQYDLELNEIREKLLEMGGKVEMMIANAMKSLVERDSALAEETIAFDHHINILGRSFKKNISHKSTDNISWFAHFVSLLTNQCENGMC